MSQHLKVKCRNARVSFRVSSRLKEVIRQTWDYKTYPKTASFYSDLENSSLNFRFSSEAEFLEKVVTIACVLSRDKMAWSNFINTKISGDLR